MHDAIVLSKEECKVIERFALFLRNILGTKLSGRDTLTVALKQLDDELDIMEKDLRVIPPRRFHYWK